MHRFVPSSPFAPPPGAEPPGRKSKALRAGAGLIQPRAGGTKSERTCGRLYLEHAWACFGSQQAAQFRESLSVEEGIVTVRISRRGFLKGLLGGCLALAAGPAYATQVEPRWIELVRVSVRLPHLPELLHGFTIAHLSDFHLGPYVGIDDVRRSVAMANALGADLVALTGDFVHRSARYAEACARELAALKAGYGVYAVLGNHDVWTDADAVAESLRRAGIHVLRNERQALTVGTARLWLIGIEDVGITGFTAFGLVSGLGWGDFKALWKGAHEAFLRALEGLPSDETRLLLVHNPDFAEMIKGKVDLVLAGHTHGGQVRLPLVGAPIVPSCHGRKYVAGLVRASGTQVYVNRGIGAIGLPVRFLCRPEVTLIVLEGA